MATHEAAQAKVNSLLNGGYTNILGQPTRLARLAAREIRSRADHNRRN